MFDYVSTKKALIAGIAATAIVLSSIPYGFAAFVDVSSATQYQSAIRDLQAKGIIQGYADGSFHPKMGINRAEFAKILLESRGSISPDGKNCFPDVAEQWFAQYVCAAKNEGIVAGYPDGWFRPDLEISFVEASKMLALAYRQHVTSEGSEWYEPYVLALESSRAIPPSIAKLDAPLMRGEMAEMMWRLSEGKTDEETKGYLNVKYPDLRVNLASDVPERAVSCADLKAFTEHAQAGYAGGVMYYQKDMMMEDRAVMAPPFAGASRVSTQSDYSTTNVQVEGVDEGDRVKTDGNYLYVVSHRDHKVRIIDVRDPKHMTVTATISFDDFFPQDLYIEGTKLVLTGDMNQLPTPVPMMEDSAQGRMMYPPMWYVQKSTVKIFDVSTKTSPKEIRSVAFEGTTISSRLLDGKMLLVLNATPRWYGSYAETKEASAKGLLPLYDDSAKNLKNVPVTDCTSVTILPRVPRPQYLVVATIPLSSTAEIGRTVILGNGTNVYASLQNLYISSPDTVYHWDSATGSAEEKTQVYRFTYTTHGTEFAAQGSVPGHILNQFSMDENGETFRIATTVSPSWTSTSDSPQKSSSSLTILNKNLEIIGSVSGIAPGESIYSVRFLGDRAYMVTFKQVDPFFVLDLSDARNPKILGRLKIPGYSNYLHPIDENHVLGFGKDVDESIDKDKVHSDDAVYYTAILGMKVALFDVSDVENPREIHREIIGTMGTDSPLLTDHRALLFDLTRGILAFPVTVYEKKSSPMYTQYEPQTAPVFQGAYVYSFDVNAGFTLKGRITHHASDDFLKAGDYWYDMSGLDIDRIIRVGTDLITVSEAKVKSSTLSGLQEEGSLDIDLQSSGELMPISPIPMLR